MAASLRVLTSIATLLLATLAMLASLVAPAAAASDPAPTLLAQEGGEQVRGTLNDGEGDPLEGVQLSVTTPDGEAVGDATSGDDGTWAVDLPGPGDYVVTLDTSTLPDGVELRDPERDTLEVSVNTGQQRTLLFPFGEGGQVSSLGQRLTTAAFSGVQFGLIIAIAAIGLSLIFGTTGLVNFAHGELVTFGAIVAWFLNAPSGTGLGVQLIIAGAIAVVITALLGGGIELGLWRPLRRRRTGLIQMLVITIGLSLALRFGMQIVFGGSSRPYFDYTIQQRISIGWLAITPRDLIVSLIAAATLVGVATMLQRTRIGKAMRAVSDNRDLAESSGIDVQRVVLFVWVMGAGLAGFGGVLNGVVENVNYLLGFRLLLLMFAAVILGGLGTAYGAMFGAIVVGLVTEISTVFFSTELKFVWALFVLIIILLVRPQGLLGRKERIG
ncbi:MAG: hypothetical protein JJT89_08610 [Nitriliruptoraceae bacterium]|nr:hypothetical protein [Nitriliruptoraceae bacterium]